MTQTVEMGRASLGDEVYRVLWQRILDNRLRPGQKLSDLRISDELGVSRTPVREALQRLVQDGIARAEPRRGFYVASFSKRDIAEIYDLRATLEVMALRLAAPRLSIEELQQALDDLEQVAARITAARTPDERQDAVAAFLEIDRAFHRRLVQRANNRRLATTIEGLWAQILVFQQAGGFLPDMLAESIQQHRLVIGALLAGEIPEAAQLLEDHIAVKERVLAHIAGQLEARMGYEQYGTSVVDAHTRV